MRARMGPRRLLRWGQHTLLPDRNDAGDGLPLSGDDELLTGFHLANAARKGLVGFT